MEFMESLQGSNAGMVIAPPLFGFSFPCGDFYAVGRGSACPRTGVGVG